LDLSVLEIVMQYGSVTLLNNLAARGILRPVTLDWYYDAARSGKIENLNWLVQQNCPMDPTEIILRAIKRDHICVMEWVFGLLTNTNPHNGPNHRSFTKKELDTILDDEYIYIHAMEYGTLSMVKWMHSHGFTFQDRLIGADLSHVIIGSHKAKCFRTDVLMFIAESGACINELHIFYAAASQPIMDLLKWGAQTRRPAFLKMVKEIRKKDNLSKERRIDPFFLVDKMATEVGI